MMKQVQLSPDIFYFYFCKTLFLQKRKRVIKKELELVHLLFGKMLNCKLTVLLLCISKADVLPFLGHLVFGRKSSTKLNAFNSILEEFFQIQNKRKICTSLIDSINMPDIITVMICFFYQSNKQT